MTDHEGERDHPHIPMSDAELAKRLRISENATFIKLVNLLGNDLKAAKAIREEGKFMMAHPEVPADKEFAAKVRAWLVWNKLEWTQENLEKAVAEIRSQP